MDKRKHRRVKTRHLVKVCGKLGVVNDISSRGIQISTAFSPKTRKVDITFEDAGEVVSFLGIIQWIKRRQKVQALNEMGVSIRNAPPEFINFVQRCYANV